MTYLYAREAQRKTTEALSEPELTATLWAERIFLEHLQPRIVDACKAGCFSVDSWDPYDDDLPDWIETKPPMGMTALIKFMQGLGYLCIWGKTVAISWVVKEGA